MSAIQDDERLLTTSQVAHILGCHPSACIRWIQKGSLLSSGARLKLQAVATPGGWRVGRSALDRFLEALTADKTQPDAAGAPKQPATPKAARVAKMNDALQAAGLV